MQSCPVSCLRFQLHQTECCPWLAPGFLTLPAALRLSEDLLFLSPSHLTVKNAQVGPKGPGSTAASPRLPATSAEASAGHCCPPASLSIQPAGRSWVSLNRCLRWLLPFSSFNAELS